MPLPINKTLPGERTFERVTLQCLERVTLQNQIFADPGSMTQKVMRGIVGASSGCSL